MHDLVVTHDLTARSIRTVHAACPECDHRLRLLIDPPHLADLVITAARDEHRATTGDSDA